MKNIIKSIIKRLFLKVFLILSRKLKIADMILSASIHPDQE